MKRQISIGLMLLLVMATLITSLGSTNDASAYIHVPPASVCQMGATGTIDCQRHHYDAYMECVDIHCPPPELEEPDYLSPQDRTQCLNECLGVGCQQMEYEAPLCECGDNNFPIDPFIEICVPGVYNWDRCLYGIC